MYSVTSTVEPSADTETSSFSQFGRGRWPSSRGSSGFGDVVDRQPRDAAHVEAALLTDVDDPGADAGGVEGDRGDVLDVGAGEAGPGEVDGADRGLDRRRVGQDLGLGDGRAEHAHGSDQAHAEGSTHRPQFAADRA